MSYCIMAWKTHRSVLINTSCVRLSIIHTEEPISLGNLFGEYFGGGSCQLEKFNEAIQNVPGLNSEELCLWKPPVDSAILPG